jgi:hypothetical protein
VGVATPQQRADQVPALPVEDDQRMVDVLLVVAVVVATFLIAVGGVCGGVEIQEHSLWSSAVFGPLAQVELEDGLGHSAARTPVGRVLQAREGRLACQVSSALGQRAANHLEQEVFSQGVRVVLVLIPTRYLEDPLPNERGKGVAPSPVSPLGHRLGDGLAQTQLLVHLGHTQKSAVGGDAPPVEAASTARALWVSKRILCVAQSVIRGASFCWVESWSTRP